MDRGKKWAATISALLRSKLSEGGSDMAKVTMEISKIPWSKRIKRINWGK